MLPAKLNELVVLDNLFPGGGLARVKSLEEGFPSLVTDLLALLHLFLEQRILSRDHVLNVDLNGEEPHGLDTTLDCNSVNFSADLLELIRHYVVQVA